MTGGQLLRLGHPGTASFAPGQDGLLLSHLAIYLKQSINVTLGDRLCLIFRSNIRPLSSWRPLRLF